MIITVIIMIIILTVILIATITRKTIITIVIILKHFYCTISNTRRYQLRVFKIYTAKDQVNFRYQSEQETARQTIEERSCYYSYFILSLSDFFVQL